MESNPYAPPTHVTPIAVQQPDPGTPPRPPTLGRSLVKWMLVCGIAAAPSFLIAGGLRWGSIFGIQGGMILGILVFVAIYVVVEMLPATQRFLLRPHVRATARVGYFTRVAISIGFPIGGAVDMICGMFSVSLVNSISPSLSFERFRNEGSAAQQFISHFVTTIVQGITLNVVLFGYMLIVFGIFHAIAAIRR